MMITLLTVRFLAEDATHPVSATITTTYWADELQFKSISESTLVQPTDVGLSPADFDDVEHNLSARPHVSGPAAATPPHTPWTKPSLSSELRLIMEQIERDLRAQGQHHVLLTSLIESEPDVHA